MANPFRQQLWPPRAGNHPTAPARIIHSGLHSRRIMAFRAIKATNVAPVKSAATRWERLHLRLIRPRAPSVQNGQTEHYVADQQYLADQSHGPSRSLNQSNISDTKISGKRCCCKCFRAEQSCDFSGGPESLKRFFVPAISGTSDADVVVPDRQSGTCPACSVWRIEPVLARRRLKIDFDLEPPWRSGASNRHRA